jgi:LacI family transcriptional regulator
VSNLILVEFVLRFGVMRNKANIVLIAECANVTPSVVSRVMRHNPTVDPGLAQRVWKAVDKLGYGRNRSKRGCVPVEDRSLGLIVSDITDPFFPEIIRSFEILAIEYGYEILVSSTFHDPKRIDVSVRRMVERRIEAVGVLTFSLEESLIEKLRAQGIHVVCVAVEHSVSTRDVVRIDYGAGIGQAVKHLATLKHERIAYVTGPSYSKTASARKPTFIKCMQAVGLRAAPDLFVDGDDTVEGGMRAFNQLAQLASRPTAIFCSNDMTAIGVIMRAFELGIAVPDDLSVIGCDDVPFAAFITPPLSTVRVPQMELARLVFDSLIRALDQQKDESADPRNSVLATHLVLRRSTALAFESKSNVSDSNRAKLKPVGVLGAGFKLRDQLCLARDSPESQPG